ncbi:Pro-Pol polyprotein [Dictyocoela muelleri]|nr:Pro-Pol polyprotein [Dictyocoela muelleri]
MVDSFTKYAWCYPSLRNDASSFSKILQRHIYLEGICSIFHSDNGGEFINREVTSLLDKYNILSTHLRPYHTQSQGQIERFNRILKSRLRCCFDFNEFDWINKIDKVVFHYNNNKHRATGMKPFVLFKGFDQNFLGVSEVNNSKNLYDTKIRLLEYVETYRREYNLRSNSILRINDKVIMVNPYRLNVRRATFESIYFDDVYFITNIISEKIIIQKVDSIEIIETSKYNIEKIN